MKTAALIIALCIAGVSQAQLTTADIRLPFIKEEAGKIVATEYHLIKAPDNSRTEQVKIYAEAPADGSAVSKEYFAYILGSVSHLFLEEIMENLAVNGREATSRQMKSLIGNPDEVINIYIAQGGVQIEWIIGTTIDRQTLSWDEVLY